MKFLRTYTFEIIGAVIGSAGAYIYYVSIGCSSGSCSILSNPFLSIVYGAIMGSLLFSLLSDKIKRPKK